MTALAWFVVGAATGAVGTLVAVLAEVMRRRRQVWREAAKGVEAASFNCKGDERSKRVQP